MNCKKYMAKYCIMLAVVLTVVSIVGFPTPSTAHIVNNDVLSIQLARSEEPVVIDSNLLTEEGQTVLLNGDFDEMTVPITVSGGDLVTAEDTTEKAIENTSETETENAEESEVLGKTLATITAVSSDETRLQAELDKQEVLLQKEGSVIQLTLRRVEPEEEETKPPINGEVSGNDAVAGTGDISGNDSEASTRDASGNDAVMTVTEEEETGEKAKELSVEVSLEYREHTFSVTFIIVDKEENKSEQAEAISLLAVAAEIEESETQEPDAGGKGVSGGDAAGGEVTGGDAAAGEITDGELTFCPRQYHPTEPILVINGEEQDCVLGGFPAMTRYTLDEQTYLLYQGGSIELLAGKTIQIDLSLTEYKADLLLESGEGNAYSIEYVELPQVPEESLPLIVGIEKKELPITFTWGIWTNLD